MTEIPEATESGATGTQKATSTETGLILQDQQTFIPASIAESIQGLAAGDARNFGGLVPATLLSGAFSQISSELQDTKLELRNTHGKLECVRDQLSECRERTAVLAERVKTSSRQKQLCNTAIAGGVAILGLAISLHNQMEWLPFLLGALGLVFVLMGWFWPSAEKDN